MILFTIPGEPCAKSRPKFTRNGHTYTPAKTVNYETLVKEIYATKYAGQALLEDALTLNVVAYFSIPKSAPRRTREAMQNDKVRPIKRPDWDNIGKIVSDALNGIAYADDSQVVSATVRKHYSIMPRVEVYICPLVNFVEQV